MSDKDRNSEKPKCKEFKSLKERFLFKGYRKQKRVVPKTELPFVSFTSTDSEESADNQRSNTNMQCNSN